jgi:16S rRNA (cytosine1402-N4)-methyltransferase
MEFPHLPVMAAEVLEFLVLRTDGAYVDCTLGCGGHAYQILNNAPAGKLLGIDADPRAIEAATEILRPFSERIELVHGNFAELDLIAAETGYARADGVLFDLGFSSLQLDEAARGFSFTHEGPLDMRLDPGSPTTARAVIAGATERELARILSEFGEERRAFPIARAIIEARDRGRLETTSDLARAVVSTKPQKRQKTLARVFQAIRICVNDELENLARGLKRAVEILAPGGRVAVISYHSLEDRMTKRYFRDCADPCTCPPRLPECVCGRKPTLRLVTKHVVTPTPAEVARNPRARSAKLRVAERLGRGGGS